MQQELLIAILAGLGGMLGWGFADFFAKKTIDRIGDIVSLAWGHIFGTAALFLVVFYQILISGKQMAIPGTFQIWLFLVLFGIMQAAVYFFLYKGFGNGQVGVLSPVFASFSGLTALMSIIFFKEHLTGFLLAGLVVVFAGVIITSIDIGALRTRRLNFSHIPGFKEVAIATLLAAFWTLFWDKFLGGNDWLMYTTLMYTFMTGAILIMAKYQKANLAVTESSLWKFLVLIGVGEVVAYLAISIGYSTTSFTSIIAILSGAFALPVIILARIFLREKITRVQTIGSLIIIAGIMLIAVL